jgi:homocysteine S-methyltransferase
VVSGGSPDGAAAWHSEGVTPTLAAAINRGTVVLDGGLATRLESRGHDLSSALWSARLLADDPDEIVAAHADFYAAGAQVATSASYQASFDGFGALGMDGDDAGDLMRRSVILAARARDETDPGAGEPRWVAASVGPYGAVLADGSEYRGDYRMTVAQLRAWHRPRLAVLADAGADVLAVETIPCAAEAEALLAEIDGTGVPAWLSLTGVVRDGVALTRAGERAAEVFAMAADVAEIIAVGVNCCDAADAAVLVSTAVTASGKPGVVYPNSGEGWDAERRRWAGPGTFSPELVGAWAQAGAALIGGCCRVGPEAIAAVRAQLNR